MAEGTTLIEYDKLMAELAGLCASKRSGTMFIKTWDNHSARFVLDRGKIVSCNYSLKRGYDALPLLKSIKAGTYYFADDVFSAIAEVPLPSTDEFLKQLSDEAFVHAPEATVRTLPKGGAALNGVLNTIKEELTRIMGPIADMIFEDYIEDHGTPENRDGIRKLIDAMSAEIGEPAKERLFIDRVSKRIG